MKSALMVAFYDQYEEWGYFLDSLISQSMQPDELFLCIDDPDQKVPALGGLPFTVLRTPERLKLVYSRGALINMAMASTEANFLITTDADCILSPDLVRTYWDIYSGTMTGWEYTVHHSEQRVKLTEQDPRKKVYVGPRYFLKSLGNMAPPSTYFSGPEQWGRLLLQAWIDSHGLRGTKNGYAAIQGCNMAFPTSVKDVCEFPESGPNEDMRWWKGIFKHGFKSHPTPDDCFVLHIGPKGTGSGTEGQYYTERGWEKENV